MTTPESPFSAIKERLEKITPGPWRVSDDPDDYGQQIKSAANLWVGATFGDEGEESGRMAQLDATFIAHAPSDIRTLLEAVEQKDAEIARLRAHIRTVENRIGFAATALKGSDSSEGGRG